MGRTCRWTPTPESPPPLPEPSPSDSPGTGCSRPRSATAPAVNTRDSPGTVSIGTAALRLLLVEYGRSACSWASRLVFVNGHGGNVQAVAEATALLRQEGRDAAWCPCTRGGRRRPRGPYRNICITTYFARGRVDRTKCTPGNRAPLADLIGRDCAMAGSPPSVPSACWGIRPPRRPPRGPACSPRWSIRASAASRVGVRTVGGC